MQGWCTPTLSEGSAATARRPGCAQARLRYDDAGYARKGIPRSKGAGVECVECLRAGARARCRQALHLHPPPAPIHVSCLRGSSPPSEPCTRPRGVFHEANLQVLRSRARAPFAHIHLSPPLAASLAHLPPQQHKTPPASLAVSGHETAGSSRGGAARAVLFANTASRPM